VIRRTIRRILGKENPETGPGVTLKEGVSLSHRSEVGRGTVLNEDVELRGPVKVGEYCAVAPGACLIAKDHDYSSPVIQAKYYGELMQKDLPRVEEKIQVGDDVWIGRNAIILKGVDIGDGAVIGAGSVVTDDVESCEVVAGNPAKHVSWRFSEEKRQDYLEAEWWELSEEKQRSFVEKFTGKSESPRSEEVAEKRSELVHASPGGEFS